MFARLRQEEPELDDGRLAEMSDEDEKNEHEVRLIDITSRTTIAVAISFSDYWLIKSTVNGSIYRNKAKIHQIDDFI